MSRQIWLWLGIFLLSLGSRANGQSDSCADLYSVACKKEAVIHRDPTGGAAGLGVPNLNQINLGKNSSLYRSIASSLQSPKSKYFRYQLLALLPEASKNPACKDFAEKPKNQVCLEILARAIQQEVFFEALFNRQSGDAFSPLIPDLPPEAEVLDGNISDIYLLHQTPEMANIQSRFNRILTDGMKDRMAESKTRKVFERIQKLMAEKVGEWVADPEVAKKVRAKIESIEFKGTDCPDSPGLTGIMEQNASYHPGRNTVSYCNGLLLTNNSEFSMAYILAHEIGHSFGPCTIAHGPLRNFYPKSSYGSSDKLDADYPIKGLISCLRSKGSIRAQINPHVNDTPESKQQLVDFAKTEPLVCLYNYDQIEEGVPDWIASEVVPEYFEKYHPNLTEEQYRSGYANVLRGVACEPWPEEVDFARHPEGRIRINNGIMAHPKILKQMNCERAKDVKYCDYKKLRNEFETEEARVHLKGVE